MYQSCGFYFLKLLSVDNQYSLNLICIKKDGYCSSIVPILFIFKLLNALKQNKMSLSRLPGQR